MKRESSSSTGGQRVRERDISFRGVSRSPPVRGPAYPAVVSRGLSAFERRSRGKRKKREREKDSEKEWTPRQSREQLSRQLYTTGGPARSAILWLKFTDEDSSKLENRSVTSAGGEAGNLRKFVRPLSRLSRWILQRKWIFFME